MVESAPLARAPLAPSDAPPRPRARERLWRAGLLALAFIQGLFYLFLFPPWQHYDEPTHFEHAWLIASRGQIPVTRELDPAMRREVAASMIEHDFYRGVPRPNLLTDDGVVSLGVLELDHPPAYYALVSLPLRLVSELDITTQLYIARAVSLVLFVATIYVAILLARELVGPGHPLRWALPLTLILLPPFASHMTAVNNDVGAVLVYSLFLLVSTRLILHGPSWRRLLALALVAPLAVLVKNTAAVALLLAPLAVVLAIWVDRGWRWRWLLALTAIGIVVPLALVLASGDAAYWYRDEQLRTQPISTRQSRADAIDGSEVLTLLVEPDDARSVINPLATDEVRALAGKRVTIGGYVWGDRPTTIQGAGFRVSYAGQAHFETIRAPLEVTTEPTLFLQSYDLPQETRRLQTALFASRSGPLDESLYVYFDALFLIEGQPPDATTIAIEGDEVLIGGERYENLLRNGSAEQVGPRVRSWLDRLLQRYGRRSPSYTVAALFDVARSGPYLFGNILPWLLTDLFAGMGWGHVRLEGIFWRALIYAIEGIAVLGALLWLVRRGRGLDRGRQAALALMALGALAIWGNALLWPLPYIFARPAMPAARYIFPTIVPTVLLLAGGWIALLAGARRRVGAFLLIGLLVLINVGAIATTLSYYGS